MKIGDIVKHKISSEYGTVHYSSFGFSIHMWSKEHNGLAKTLGEDPKVLEQYWEVIDMPEGYELMPYGGLRKL